MTSDADSASLFELLRSLRCSGVKHAVQAPGGPGEWMARLLAKRARDPGQNPFWW
jgi:hypothetical protein